jgi:Fe-S-cluster-containing dehydrogenase component/formate-dependent nitrite reductase membrane component NrfD
MRLGFVIDQDRCIGCHACTVACKEEHNVPVGVFRTWVKSVEKGVFPDTRRHFAVLRCNHCDNAPCVEICPTRALFYRPDRIVDFDSSRCIGCKSCMQACPYDAIYLDPETHTAAKCNFCAHRIEQGLEPACVIVCPTQAITCGDLDQPASKASALVASDKVVARKPYKGTEPKLFYIGVDGDLIDPGAVSHSRTYFSSELGCEESRFDRSSASSAPGRPGQARQVYDVAHPAPWGRMISAYLWTKSIGAGVLLVAALLLMIDGHDGGPLLRIWSPLVAIGFLAITAALLVFDLKRPDRFYYLLTKANPRSWLVIGGFILIAYGALATAWLGVGAFGNPPPPILAVLTAAGAVACACYSAFLFAQARGRDLWQSPLFCWHLLTHALIAGSSVLILMAIGMGAGVPLLTTLAEILIASLAFSLAMVLAEPYLPPLTDDVRRAAEILTRGALATAFWGLLVVAGLLVPIALLWMTLHGVGANPARVAAAVLAISGVWVFEDLFVQAGQAPPLS